MALVFLNKPIDPLESFKVWLDENYVQTPPKGLLGKAMGYLLNNWELLICLLGFSLVSVGMKGHLRNVNVMRWELNKWILSSGAGDGNRTHAISLGS